jgi:hypothetical protein
MMDKARAAGIDLTVAETSGSPSLQTAYTMMRNTPGAGSEAIRSWEQGVRAPQIDAAIGRQLEQLSPEKSIFEASRKGVDVAKKRLVQLEEARSKAVQPLYEKAFQGASPVDISPVMAQIEAMAKELPQKGSTAGKALSRVRTMLGKEEQIVRMTPSGPKQATVMTPQSDLRILDTVKKEIDNMLTGPDAASIKKDALRRLASIKDNLTKTMDAASPEYSAARALYGKKSGPVDKFTESLLGSIVKKEGETVVTAPRILFDSQYSSPEAIRRAKAFFGKRYEKEWNGLVRSYLQDELQSMSKTVAEQTSGIISKGGKYSKRIMGSIEQRNALRAAMTPQQFSAWSNLADVLDATLRISDANSKTAFYQAGQKIMREEAGGPLAKWLRTINITPQGMARTLEDWRQPEYAKAVVDALLTPKGMAQISRLKQLPPGPRKAIRTMFLFSTIVGGAQAIPGASEYVPEGGVLGKSREP